MIFRLDIQNMRVSYFFNFKIYIMDIKEMVKQKYGEIALQDKAVNMSSCCGAGGCSTEVYNIMSDDYGNLKGYNSEADLGLGCGLPTQFAGIKKGDTVIDLGSGAGNDCFVARHEVGDSGKVIGIDFTPEMIEKARLNADKLQFNNVEFRMGDIENMPLGAELADVIVSNCVLNLVPDKNAVFRDMFRVLKPGGHFCISDVVLSGKLPDALKKDAEMYAGCVSGAIQKDVYLELIAANGFQDTRISIEKPINIPDDILIRYMNQEEINTYRSGATGIFSITVSANKPTSQNECKLGSGCC